MSSTASNSTYAIDLLVLQFPKKFRLTTAELAVVLNIDAGTIRNKSINNTFPVHTYIDGRQRFADIRDVADYLDRKRDKRKAGRPTKASILDK